MTSFFQNPFSKERSLCAKINATKTRKTTNERINNNHSTVKLLNYSARHSCSLTIAVRVILGVESLITDPSDKGMYLHRSILDLILVHRTIKTPLSEDVPRLCIL